MSEAELCSRLSAQRGLPLIGSAGCHSAILAFELPPPWTPRLVGSRGGGDALDAALVAIAELSADVRVLALEPSAEAEDGRRRVLWFRRDEGWFSGYSRREYRVLPETLPAVLHQLAETGFTSADPVGGGERGRDLLVCTHGSRDACCGRFGYPLYRRLGEAAARAAADLRVWRCSHLGGHRFAPTLLDLPSGRLFGRLGDAEADALLDGGPALREGLKAVYRGRMALPEPVQILERELWLQAGPGFEDAGLRWEVEPLAQRWKARLEAQLPDGRRFEARAVVERATSGSVSTPASCGRDPEVESPWSIVA
jgi:hypothetical protein